MNSLLADWNALATVFLGCAIVGGGLFLIRLVLMLIGTDHDLQVDGAGHLDLSHVDHVDSDVSFKLFTFQGITAFLLIFGLAGLTTAKGFGLGAILSTTVAGAAGAAAAWVVARIMNLMIGMQSSGTIDIKNAVGQEGTVYLTISAGGVGKVQVSVQNRLQEFEAVASDNTEIKTGEQIKVVFLKGDVLVVEKI